MPSPSRPYRTFFNDNSPRPLGRLTMAGAIRKTWSSEPERMRVFGQYALVLLLHGGGAFRDALGCRAQVQAGDMICIFPEIAHRYGPLRGDDWDELYVCFDGAVFDLWRREGLLDPARPIISLANPRDFAQRLESILREPSFTTTQQHLTQLHRFMALLSEVTRPAQEPADAAWLAQAKAMLQSNLGREMRGADVAREVGWTYESFRKAFTRATGVSPMQFRTAQRIEAAKALLSRYDMTHEVVAHSLGFRDAAHLARRFKEVTGETPGSFRRQAVPKSKA